MRNERGSVLIFSYLVIGAMVALGSALTVRTLAEQTTSSRSVRLASAFQTAEAGLDQALIELRANEDWTGASGLSVPNGGYYDVAVTEDTANPTLKTLTITGHYPSTDPTAQGYQRRQVEAIVQMSSPSVFQYGVFGYDSVTVKNDAVTDSYDSDNGDYEEQTAGENGDVGTNNTAEKSIQLENDAIVHGQAIVGPGLEDPATAVEIKNDATITGDPPITALSQALDAPTVTSPDTCSGNLHLKNEETLTLSEASSPYCYGKVHLNNEASLTIQGNVVVFVSELRVNNDVQVNSDGRPTQLVVKLTSNKDVKIENDAVFVGAIYAPSSKASIKNDVQFYGAVVADEVFLENDAQLHYDEALRHVGPSSGESDALLLSWREL